MAQECYLNPTDPQPGSENTLTVGSQEDLDQATNGCTTLHGDIRLLPSYSGSFTLNGIVEVYGQIFKDHTSASGNEYVSEFQNMTSFEMVDLLYIRGLTLVNVTEVRLPHVQLTGHIWLESPFGETADFGGLTGAKVIRLQGPWKK